MILSLGAAFAADVLWYHGNDGDRWAEVEGIDAAVRSLGGAGVERSESLPALDGVRLLFVASPAEYLDTSIQSALLSFVDGGGVLVLVGEFPGFSADSVDTLNVLLSDLDLDARLGDTSWDCVDSAWATAGSSGLAVGSPGYSCSNEVEPGDAAEEIYRGESGQLLAVEEAGVVLLADSNLVVDDLPFGADNSAFVAALYEASCTGLGDRDGDGEDAAVCGGDDCDDADATVGSFATEVCDGVDQDCDGVADDGATDATDWYPDADGDGWGDAGPALTQCEAPEGYVADSADCDDTSAEAHPGAEEHCDEVDEDCDGETDEDPVDPFTWFADADGDGHGDPESPTVACDAPAAHVEGDGDCDDSRADVFPGATELCDGADQDCDGVEDDLAADATTWSSDYDGDGYGGGDLLVSDCEQPDGYADNTDDCDDHDAAVHPGAAESCDEADQDCDGEIDEDAADGETWYDDQDDDGWGDDATALVACEVPPGFTDLAGDCEDADPAVNPGEDEVCDGLDQDCDALADEDLPVESWYTDADGDGLGDDATLDEGCDRPEGSVVVGGDCDDADPEVGGACPEDSGGGKPEDPGGCGCAGLPHPAAAGWLAALLLRRRR